MRRALSIAICLSLGCAGGIHRQAGTCSPSGDSKDPEVHLKLGKCWESAGNLNLALSEYRKVLSLSPHNVEAREKLALGYLHNGEDIFAAREFLLLLNDDPDNTTALFKLGTIFYRQGKEEMAISSFSRVLEIDPGYSKAYYNLGAIYVNRNDREEAEKNFKIYMMQVPNSREEEAIKKWMETNETHGHQRPGQEGLQIQ